MQVVFRSAFNRQVQKLKEKKIKNKTILVIKNVEDAGKISEIKNIKKLSGHSSAYRIKLGNYRIGLFIEEDIAEFTTIVHRKDIYKKFP